MVSEEVMRQAQDQLQQAAIDAERAAEREDYLRSELEKVHLELYILVDTKIDSLSFSTLVNPPPHVSAPRFPSKLGQQERGERQAIELKNGAEGDTRRHLEEWARESSARWEQGQVFATPHTHTLPPPLHPYRAFNRDSNRASN